MVDKILLSSNSEHIFSEAIIIFSSLSSSDFLEALFSSSVVVDAKVDSENTTVRAHLSSKPLRAPSTVRRYPSIIIRTGKQHKKKDSQQSL